MRDATPNVNPTAFRRVMGLFATGVTIVAAQHENEIHGMTANALSSVSLDPLLVLVCLGKQARMNRFIQGAGGFSINILSDDQESLARYFSGAWPHQSPPEFRFVPWPGGPRLVGGLAAAGCVVDQWIEAGDHWIVLARVVALHEDGQRARPLLFFSSRYRRLADIEPAAPPEQWSDDAVQIYYAEWSAGGPPPPLPGEDPR